MILNLIPSTRPLIIKIIKLQQLSPNDLTIDHLNCQLRSWYVFKR
jgi:hypothetical protein